LKGCRKAEIIPIEPDPDNAGGGKKSMSFSVSLHNFELKLIIKIYEL
jgi:hypothetical protein